MVACQRADMSPELLTIPDSCQKLSSTQRLLPFPKVVKHLLSAFQPHSVELHLGQEHRHSLYTFIANLGAPVYLPEFPPTFPTQYPLRLSKIVIPSSWLLAIAGKTSLVVVFFPVLEFFPPYPSPQNSVIETQNIVELAVYCYNRMPTGARHAIRCPSG